MKQPLISIVLCAALLTLACGGGTKSPAASTPTQVASTPVGASPTATTVLPAATVGPSPTATTVLPAATVDAHRDVDALLANAGDEVATWLRDQPWLYDGSDGSLEAVKSITGAAFDPDPVKAKQKQDEVMTLLHGLDQSTWYDGTLSDADKAAIASVFELVLHLPNEAAATRYASTEPMYPELQKYDWQRELLDVLTQRHFATVPGTSEQITLLVASPDDDSLADEVLKDASDNLTAIEGLAGAISSSRLLFILDPGLAPPLCGEAIPEDFLILVQPNGCFPAEVVVHEMTHVAVHTATTAIWYQEGVAELVALELTGQPDPKRLNDLRSELQDETFLEDANEGTDYGATQRQQDTVAGLLFLLDLKDIIGMDNLSKSVKVGVAGRSAREGFVLGQDVLKAILDATPPDKLKAVEALIADRCRTTARSGTALVPCTVTP